MILRSLGASGAKDGLRGERGCRARFRWPEISCLGFRG